MTSESHIPQGMRIGVRLKISALWVAMLFLFAYGDRGGKVSGIEITQTFLLAASVYVAIASLMIFLTLVLRPTVSRWTNIVLPILYIVSIVASVIGESWVYFWFLSLAEGALLLLIIWYAWRWPTLER
jgi:hypothetical protein